MHRRRVTFDMSEKWLAGPTYEEFMGRWSRLLRRFWDAAAAVDPAARELDEGRRFPICRPDALKTLFRASGLRDVACEPLEISTRFSDFTDFWRPFLGGTGPAPSYVSGLDPVRREALIAHLERTLCRQPDGAISLIARAWAVRGVAP